MKKKEDQPRSEISSHKLLPRSTASIPLYITSAHTEPVSQTMGADPWADAPPSPRPRSQHGKPNKATAQSPFVRSSPKFEDAPQPVASSSRQTSPIRDAAPTDGDDLDEFDDFDAPAAVVASKGAEDDGFGDFGRFEEGDFGVAGMEQEQIDAMAENVDKEPHGMQKQWVSLSAAHHEYLAEMGSFFTSPLDILAES